ncbi:MAG: zf-TFIIB domain-containing protein [Deltaproteobacteria bacterium]|nr:zf-TFIIB domain-containing protein [Deltaproteobacteria bacterium]
MTESILCPRCQTDLQPEEMVEVGARLSILRCESCEGRFFQPGDLRKIDGVIEPRLVEIRRIPTTSEQQVSLRCPVCHPKTWMTKGEHQRDRKVIMDVCPSCNGTWLDPGELEAIHREGWSFLLQTQYVGSATCVEMASSSTAVRKFLDTGFFGNRNAAAGRVGACRAGQPRRSLEPFHRCRTHIKSSKLSHLRGLKTISNIPVVSLRIYIYNSRVFS